MAEQRNKKILMPVASHLKGLIKIMPAVREGSTGNHARTKI
jgi:hypothetical protein